MIDAESTEPNSKYNQILQAGQTIWRASKSQNQTICSLYFEIESSKHVKLPHFFMKQPPVNHQFTDNSEISVNKWNIFIKTITNICSMKMSFFDFTPIVTEMSESIKHDELIHKEKSLLAQLKMVDEKIAHYEAEIKKSDKDTEEIAAELKQLPTYEM